MIIERIDIKSFGVLTDLTLEFADTVNVIEGQNEAGKSTIAAFIKYMLYGFDKDEKNVDGTPTEREKRLNWNTGIAEGSMTVRADGKRYIINRSTVPAEHGYREESSIIDAESGANLFGKMEAGRVFLGVDKDLFLNTAFIGQLGDASIDGDKVKEAIESILFSESAERNAESAMNRIRDKMDRMLRPDGEGGMIYDLTKRREELEADMLRQDEDNKQILVKETELHAIRREKALAEEKLASYYDSDNCYKNVMLIQTFDKLHELEEECAEKTRAYNAFIEENTHADYVPTEQYVTDIVVARRCVNDTYRNLCEAESLYERERTAVGITHEIESAIEKADELGGEDKILEGARKQRSSAARNVALSVGSGAVALASLIIEIAAKGVLAGVGMRVLFGALLALGIVGAALFAVGFVKAKRSLAELCLSFGVEAFSDLVGKIAVIREARAKRDGMIRSTEQAKAQRDKARVDYDTAKAELTRVIVRWGEEPPASNLEEFLDRLENRVSSFLERRRTLSEDKNFTELTVREIRRTLSDKNEIDIRAQVPPLKRKSLAGVNHDEIVTGIANLKSKIADAERRAYAVESELNSIAARAGDLGVSYSRMHDLDEKISEMKLKHKAHYLALRAIEGAADNMRNEISPRLGQFATELMGVMTDRRYTSFDVNDGLTVSYTAAGGEKKSIDFLSGGTRDLAYVAVRLALIDMLYKEQPPVCFDETFAHQDNIRAQAMMKALGNLAEEGYQSFVFTCRGREGALAGELMKNVGVFKLSVSDSDYV